MNANSFVVPSWSMAAPSGYSSRVAVKRDLSFRGLSGIFGEDVRAPQSMIQDTIAELEARIQGAGTIKPEHRAELLRLLATLRSEISTLSQTNRDDAESIAGFTSVSAHEAMRQHKNPELMRHSLDGLASSVADFEETHPQLVQIVNRICQTLSNLGI